MSHFWRTVAPFCLCLASTYCWGDAFSGGPRQYPQFRSVSGLPGGCFAIGSDGRFNSNGALSFSTPLGFSLSNKQLVILGSSMSNSTSFKFGDSNAKDKFKGVNGTLLGLAGFSGEWGAATIGYMVLSTKLDHVINLQYQLPLRTKAAGVSIGVQDLMSEGGSMGDTYALDGKCSRSVYVAGTVDAGRGVYATAAYGNYRFDGVVGNLSFPVAPKTKACIEFDGFDWNVLTTYSPTANTAVSIGLVNRNYAFWSIAYRF